MNNHIDNKKIIEAILKSGKPEFGRMELEHISNCEKCKRKIEVLTLISKTPEAGEPSDAIELRLRQTYASIKNSQNKKLFDRFNFRPLLRPAFALPMILLILFPLYFFIMKDGLKEQAIEPAKFSIEQIQNKVYANNKILNKDYLIQEGSNLRTGLNSSVELNFKDFHLVRLTGSSDVLISKNRFDDINNRYIVTYKINQGTVYCKTVKNAKIKLLYSFITPDCEVVPIGTEFILHVSKKNNTVLFVIDGRLKILGLKKKSPYYTEINYKYIISDSIKHFKIYPEENKIISSIIETPEKTNFLIYNKKRVIFNNKASERVIRNIKIKMSDKKKDIY